MENQELRDHLEKLKAEIEQTHSVDEKGRELLHNLDSEIHDLLQRSDDDMDQPVLVLTSQLEKNIRHFEVTHPDLTSAMAQLMSILGNAGL